jgi:hypothetical protein
MRQIDGEEPELLDILDVPIEKTGPDEGCQPENRLMRQGAWKKIRTLQSDDVLKYCETGGLLFHNTDDCVAWEELQNLPREKKKSLQLIRCKSVEFYKTISSRGKWQARARFKYGRTTYDLAVTDSLAEQMVFSGNCIDGKYLLTISLAGKVSDSNPYCYKLVAGVIEL